MFITYFHDNSDTFFQNYFTEEVMEYLNRGCLEAISDGAFRQRKPYPWVDIPASLTPEGFQRLRATLPEVSMFKRTEGNKSQFGRAYHNRYILHYQEGITVADPWREFTDELLHGKTYDAFIRRMLGLGPRDKIIMTLEWFYAWQGCSVSPHCDALRKLATHIFYFNTDEDWRADWGGHVLIQDDHGKMDRRTAPSFDELDVSASVDPRGNGSLLFQRTDHSWHAVKPLGCPGDNLRKLFMVVINRPTMQVMWRRIRGKDPDGYPLKMRAA
jgi:hypothetical protein